MLNTRSSDQSALGFGLSSKWFNQSIMLLELQIFAIRILSLTYSSSGCESHWSTFGIIRPNDFGILSPSWEFSIKIGTTLSTLKKEKIV